jgi:hypothetical protein
MPDEISFARLSQVDVAPVKTTRITEPARFDFPTDVFNLIHHPELDPTSLNSSSGSSRH